MRKLETYILKDFLLLFVGALFIITFIMSLGALYRAVDIISRGIDIGVVGQFFINNIPYLLSYTLPMSVLFATLLLFGRLSAESELVAMRSGGLSLFQIAAPLLGFAILLSAFSLYNNSFLYPQQRYENRVLLSNVDVGDPLKLLDEGRFIRDFPGYMIYVKKKQGRQVEDLIVYELNAANGAIERSIQSESGVMHFNEATGELRIDLYDARIEMPHPDEPDNAARTRYLSAKLFPVRLEIPQADTEEAPAKRRRDMTLPEMWHAVCHVEQTQGALLARERDVYVGSLWVRIHQRLYMGVAPLTFMLVGIPLGIRSHRRESSVGMLLSLAVLFVYYLLILLADAFEHRPEWMPWLIPWAGVILAQVGGLIALRRLN
jgi:lipopolysaccharide export system permease protein